MTDEPFRKECKYFASLMLCCDAYLEYCTYIDDYIDDCSLCSLYEAYDTEKNREEEDEYGNR